MALGSTKDFKRTVNVCETVLKRIETELGQEEAGEAYQDMVCQLEEETEKLQGELLLNRTHIFLPAPTKDELGSLLRLEDIFLAGPEKKFIK